MPGLIDVGILKPELGNSFAAGYQQAEQARNLLGQQRQQTELNQVKLDQLKQDRAMLTDLQTKLQAAGKSTDPNEFFKAMIQSGNPEYMSKGYEGMQRYQELQRADALLRKEAPELFGSAPAAPPVMRMPSSPVASANALGSGTFDVNAAPVNALAPTAAPTVDSDNRVRELRNKVLLYGSSGDPRLKAMADVYKTELQELTKPQNLAPGHQLYSGGKVVYTAPAAQTELQRLIGERDALSPNDPRRAVYENAIRKQTTHAPATVVNLPAQEKAFESELGKGQAENLIKSKSAAQDAASIIDTVKIGRDIMKSGMITGAGADFLVNFNQGLKTAGIDAGYADAAANSQAFTANMAGNVGKLIKQFGAGTGLSDADREFAKDMAGGRVSLDPKAITRILSINERAARNVITRHNKDVKGIKTNIPLEVEMPTEVKTPATGSVITNPQFPGFSIGKQ